MECRVVQTGWCLAKNANGKASRLTHYFVTTARTKCGIVRAREGNVIEVPELTQACYKCWYACMVKQRVD